jgi:hypothetical protein
MRKLKMGVLMPLVYFLSSILLFGRALLNSQEPSTSARLWFAVSGPVLLLLDAAKWLVTRRWLPSELIGGGGNRTIFLIFLLGGIPLWYLTGSFIDHWSESRTASRSPASHLTTTSKLLLILCGIRLIFHGLDRIRPAYPGQTHSALDLMNGAIVLLWSVALILLPAWRMDRPLSH